MMKLILILFLAFSIAQRCRQQNKKIDDGDESDWDTVTEVKEAKNSSVKKDQQYSPRDDDTSYQQSSVEIPYVGDNVLDKKQQETDKNVTKNANQKRNSDASVSSKQENFSERSDKIPATDFPAKRTDNFRGGGGGSISEASSKTASKYLPQGISANSSKLLNSNNNNPKSAGDPFYPESSPRNVMALIGAETTGEMDKASNQSTAISDSESEMASTAIAVENTNVEGTLPGRNQESTLQKQHQKWSSTFMPPPPPLSKEVAGSPYSTVMDQSPEEDVSGENYFDLVRQSRWQYDFAQSPSGADMKFILPRENPRPKMLRIVDKVEIFTQRGLAEVCSTIRVLFAVIIAIFVETVRTIVGGLIQPIIVAVISLLGSYLLQPIFVALFNYIIAPILSFLHNIFAASFRSIQPLFNLFNQLIGSISELIRSFRLVDVHLDSAMSEKSNRHIGVGALQSV